MFTKQEASKLRMEFWTGFGRYMNPVMGASGLPVNWINYRTGVKPVRFLMDAAAGHVMIGIELSSDKTSILQICIDGFVVLKPELEMHTKESWQWEMMAERKGRNIYKIYTQKTAVSIYKKSDWPEMISFLKSRIIALDAFWLAHHDIFEMQL